MNSNIQLIKSQIENFKFQINNIEMQNNNMMIMMMMNMNPINEQLLNLSMQMFHTGIQTFKAAITEYMGNQDKFYKQLKIISGKISNIINNYNIQQQQMMMIPPPMMMNPGINLNNPKKISKINCVFKNTRKDGKVIVMDTSSTVEKLLNKYLDDVYYSREAKITFWHNGRINRHEQKTIGDYFKYPTNVTITVVEID